MPESGQLASGWLTGSFAQRSASEHALIQSIAGNDADHPPQRGPHHPFKDAAYTSSVNWQLAIGFA
jgi:hypothetical protein